MNVGRCVNCGMTIRHGTPYITPATGRLGQGIAHKNWCPRIVTEDEREQPPELGLRLYPPPPEAS